MNKHIELPAQAPERIWTCKIGGPAPQFSTGADLPMRNAVMEAFALLTGADPEFIFSGWGGELTEPERAVVENRLPSPEYEAAHSTPKLDDIEQYRMQMAGISTAALGYWKEGDEIHPDYDTVPLRDVAKLYAKYDQLYAAQQRVLAEQAVPVATRYNVERDGDDLMVCFDDHEKGEKCDYRRYVPAYRKAGAPTAMNREALIDLIAEHLSGTYHCHRVWNAWNVGTMSEGDFSEVNDSDTPAELADAILPMLASPPAPQEAQAEHVMTYLGRHTMDCGENGSHDMEMHKLIPAGTKLYAAPVAQPATEQAEAPSDTLRIACITLDGSTLYIPAKGITDFGIGEDDGETYALTFKTMTRAEFDALGEFDGF